MIEIKDLSFRYSSNLPVILNSFNFQARSGEIIHIKGSSGSGKTTLLNLLCGVIPKVIKGNLSGSIIIAGRDLNEMTLPQISPQASLLMQDPEIQLFFPIVEQELAFGPENLLIYPQEIRSRISNALNILNIKHLRFRETANLSFGEKKLVALAALITLDPKVFLLDEPTAGISSEQIGCLKKMISMLSKQGKVIFIAEHLDEILDLPHKTILLTDSGEK